MSSKKFGPCPRCGADFHAYVFVGRWKHCYACGYDRAMEFLLSGVRRGDKWGHPVKPRTRNKVMEYLDNLKPLEV